MDKYEKAAIFISIVIASVGFGLSFCYGGTHFSRSGALIVVVGIIYGLQELPSRLANIDLWARNQAEEAKPEVIRSLKEQGADDDTAESVYKETVRATLKEINTLAKSKRKKLVLIESVILISGTLIWGFGDIPFSQC